MEISREQYLAVCIIAQAVKDFENGRRSKEDERNPKAFLINLSKTIWGEACSEFLNISKIEKWAKEKGRKWKQKDEILFD